MLVITYSSFRAKLKLFLDGVVENSKPLFIKRANGEDVVVLSKSDYESLNETIHLLGSAKNAERLMRGIEEYKSGKTIEKDLIE
jgi:antitoxin YefM